MACLDKTASVVELLPTSKAYFSILDATLTRISNNVMAIVHTNSLTDRSATGIQQRLYTIMCIIAETFRDEKKEVFLGKQCSELVKRDLALDDPKTTAQLVFILFGAFTTLYIPIQDPEPGKLQMKASNLGAGIQRRSTATWHIGSQELNDDDLDGRHRNPPGQGYPTGVLTLPYSGSQGQRSLLTRPVTLPGSGQGTLQGRIEVETV
jgi:hypothetical protein